MGTLASISSLPEPLDGGIWNGCHWRFLPAEYPPWSTVYGWFRQWRLDGTWERLHTTLRKHLRRVGGRDPQPSAAIIDSQSVKTTSVGGVHGDDGAKNLSGRTRHVLVDTQGLVLRATVHSAALQDRAAVPLRCWKARHRRFHGWSSSGLTKAIPAVARRGSKTT